MPVLQVIRKPHNEDDMSRARRRSTLINRRPVANIRRKGGIFGLFGAGNPNNEGETSDRNNGGLKAGVSTPLGSVGVGVLAGPQGIGIGVNSPFFKDDKDRSGNGGGGKKGGGGGKGEDDSDDSDGDSDGDSDDDDNDSDDDDKDEDRNDGKVNNSGDSGPGGQGSPPPSQPSQPLPPPSQPSQPLPPPTTQPPLPPARNSPPPGQSPPIPTQPQNTVISTTTTSPTTSPTPNPTLSSSQRPTTPESTTPERDNAETQDRQPTGVVTSTFLTVDINSQGRTVTTFATTTVKTVEASAPVASSPLDAGLIGGIIAGVVVFIVILISAFCLLRKRRKHCAQKLAFEYPFIGHGARKRSSTPSSIGFNPLAMVRQKPRISFVHSLLSSVRSVRRKPVPEYTEEDFVSISNASTGSSRVVSVVLLPSPVTEEKVPDMPRDLPQFVLRIFIDSSAIPSLLDFQIP
ncbi:hypothetical protein Moror_7315 [Moniliophthora roreri MCA 2997]|uniref:Uncharacterized protein n=1 Tax=Moniliophthora roreri (strain MCA 2997) TaxID=1381753 RepID=V2YWW0_MONRO|nr:hypothetical protein Moror_7315 [Moniliophthora roreri MCA 2997]